MGPGGPSRAFSSRARAEPKPSPRFIKPKLRLKLGSFSSRAEPEPSPSSLARYQPYWVDNWTFKAQVYSNCIHFQHFSFTVHPIFSAKISISNTPKLGLVHFSYIFFFVDFSFPLLFSILLQKLFSFSFLFKVFF